MISAVNPFGRFYDAEAEFYKMSDGGYSNADTEEYLGKAVCDIQPFRDETRDAARGLDEVKQYKLFADKYPFIKTGNIVKFAGGRYRITGVSEWTFGLTAVMRCIDD